MKQQCPDCASGSVFGVGNGKCSKCHGGGKVGTIADDIAGGKLSCPRCHGTGKCPTCGGSGLVSGSAAVKPERPHANAELNPLDDKVAVRVHCPKCGDLDWFEWKFLGKLTDPVCGHTWYAGSGFYTIMQIRAAFAAGGRFTNYLTSGISGEGAWIAKALGWFMGTILGLAIRLEFGVAMIPIQAIVGLCQPNKEKSEIVSRSVVVGASVLLGGLGLYSLATGPGGSHTTRAAIFYSPSTIRETPNSSLLRSTILDVPDSAPNSQKLLGRWQSTEGEDLVKLEFFTNGRMRALDESGGGGPNGRPGKYHFTDEDHLNVDRFIGPITVQITRREMKWVFPNGMLLSFTLQHRGNEHFASR
jgi:hypothetical protein